MTLSGMITQIRNIFSKNSKVISDQTRTYSSTCLVTPCSAKKYHLHSKKTGRRVQYDSNVNHKQTKRVHLSSKMAVRLFEDKEHAGLYAQYRPTYPEGVFSTIVEYYKTGNGTKCNYELAVDVGCGNGQSSVPLCNYFRHVIGTDVSEQQISSAPKDIENLSFRVNPGENLGFLQDESADVITIAQALHWLDRDVFYKELKRVLKPGGVFAAFGYGHIVLDDPEADKYMNEFYSDLLGSYWNEGRKHVENNYKDFDHPFLNWERIENEEISIKRTMPVDAYVGYLSTWSSWRKYVKEHPHADDLDQLRQRFNDIYKAKSGIDNSDMSIYWPGFMLIGRKPAN